MRRQKGLGRILWELVILNGQVKEADYKRLREEGRNLKPMFRNKCLEESPRLGSRRV